MPGLAWCIALVTVQPPEPAPSLLTVLSSEPNLIWYLLVPILLAAYYFAALSWIRRSNPLGAVVIQYSPPLNLSPAAMRYVLTGEFDEKEVAAAVVHLAARGLIRFEGLDQYYSVSRTSAEAPPDLPPEELAVYRVMFNLDGGGTDPFPGRLRTYEELAHQAYLLPPVEDKKFQLLAGAVTKSLKAFTEQKYFTPNFRYIAPAAIISLFLLFLRVQHPAVALLAAVGFTFAALYFDAGGPSWPENPAGMAGVAGVRLVILLFSLIIFAVLKSGSLTYLLSTIATVCIHLYLVPQMRGRTPLGRELLSKIEGYREFLKEVELDRMQRLKMPAWVPTRATECLAYAIALDLGAAWDNYRANSGYWTAYIEKSPAARSEAHGQGSRS
jgi:hypothetical protein